MNTSLKKIRNCTILVFTSILMACKTTPDAEAIKKEVLNIHDKLMIDGEKVIKNRMILDTVLLSDKVKTAPDSTLQKQKITDLITRLNKADELMMDWMHEFKDDYKGKAEEQNLAYFKSEMIKIRGVEDTYIRIIRESDSVLNLYHAKSASVRIKTHKHE
ncbi:hypothetical protein [Pedobacter punctiformis]|uniref:Viral A-type inclusion protein n=1 Tax=Pedobacter punctiformis TaxID=3004097 RepID=A0ABT4L721_9SPHI|nr:hypothetical protein [Pedobacter sp. HCMS5-2]MCZ4243710.1 hypothetical protein [Pedobacter sp. HCMS5-2]